LKRTVEASSQTTPARGVLILAGILGENYTLNAALCKAIALRETSK